MKIFCLPLIIIAALFSAIANAQPEPASSATNAGAGQLDYQIACGPCHMSTSTGYGAFKLRQRLGDDKALLHERTDLTAELVRVAVRNGFGTMPALSMVEVNDEQLKRIVSYLVKQ